ncbi:MAG: type II secretion system F family protein [Planctomycetes bacterium]|nr:type II secretion system F family protein [Planctomycetota bacterium]
MSPGHILVLVAVFGVVLAIFVLAVVRMEKRSGGRASDRFKDNVRQVPVEPKRRRAPSRKKRGHLDALPLRLARRMSRIWRIGGSSNSRLQEMLVHAGIRAKGATEVFLGAKMALTVAFPAAAVAFCMWRARWAGAPLNPRLLIISGSMAVVAGLMLPTMWLRRKANKRVDSIRLSLPDALDLLIVCIESGLGLEAALVRIGQEMAQVAPEFCEELALLNLEIAAGKPRQECLKHLGLRTGCEEVESLVARINQAAKFGTNLGDSLRIHSESLRRKRRQQAEERAAKTTVKLLFPLIFFIFPAVFVVILGPAVPRLIEHLG